METNGERIETDALRNLVPLNALTVAQLQELSAKATLQEFPRGQYLFHEGDPAVEYIYLLRGKVDLLQGDRLAEQVVGGLALARFALAHHQPRKFSARTESPTLLLRIDSELVNSFVSWSESSGYEVAELGAEDTDDWMTQDVEGNVWYFGEISKTYEDGELTDIEGSWTAGVDGAKPGILMKAAPEVGDVYRQEFALGEAEDAGEVVSTTGSATVPAASCSGSCVVTRDFTPIEPDGEEFKYYLSGVGLILEENPETGGRVELVDVTFP